jgi:hypothetical protein
MAAPSGVVRGIPATWRRVRRRPTAQTGPGWVSLFDGKTIGDQWNKVGETNWRIEDGAIVADKRTSKAPAYLVTKEKYKDFELHVEFWASDDANSGIFMRCQNPKEITDRSCYEANIFDQRKDPTYGTGGIVHFAEVNPMPKAGGKWNTFEITAKGRQIIVMLNGRRPRELHNGLFAKDRSRFSTARARSNSARSRSSRSEMPLPTPSWKRPRLIWSSMQISSASRSG